MSTTPLQLAGRAPAVTRSNSTDELHIPGTEALLQRLAREIDQLRGLEPQAGPHIAGDSEAREHKTDWSWVAQIRRQRRAEEAAQRALPDAPAQARALWSCAEMELSLISGAPIGQASGSTFSTQGLTAASLGLNRRTVSRALSWLRSQGVVSILRAHAQQLRRGDHEGQVMHDGSTSTLRGQDPERSRWNWRPEFQRDLDQGRCPEVALRRVLTHIGQALNFTAGSEAWKAAGHFWRALFSLSQRLFWRSVERELRHSPEDLRCGPWGERSEQPQAEPKPHSPEDLQNSERQRGHGAGQHGVGQHGAGQHVPPGSATQALKEWWQARREACRRVRARAAP